MPKPTTTTIAIPKQLILNMDLFPPNFFVEKNLEVFSAQKYISQPLKTISLTTYSDLETFIHYDIFS